VNTLLVTGSGGFIGRVLIKQLREAGHFVLEFDLPQGDISCMGSLDEFCGKGVQHVFHLAGKTFVPDSWKDPYTFYRVNALGTINVLEFCRKTGATLTFVSSYLYGEPEYLPIDEHHPVKSYNPYSHSKMVAESACRFYAENYAVKLSVLRPFNAYGPGQSRLFLINELIGKVLDPGIQVVEVMDLRPKRDYVYVDDLAHALLRSLDGPEGIYNIGSGVSVSVEEILLLIMEYTGIRKEYRSREERRPNEILDLYADISKADSDLGWRPQVSFEEGIRRCLADYVSSHQALGR
jgi:nucleoside-diphosphate-sugar epimerase